MSRFGLKIPPAAKVRSLRWELSPAGQISPLSVGRIFMSGLVRLPNLRLTIVAENVALVHAFFSLLSKLSKPFQIGDMCQISCSE